MPQEENPAEMFGGFTEKLYLCSEDFKTRKIMEATVMNISTGKRISKTARVARANKWVIELVSPELQAQCKSYKDGKKVVNY